MKKGFLLIVVACMLAAMAGCSGITQEMYDEATKERDTLLQEKEDLQAEIDALNEQVASLSAKSSFLEGFAESYYSPVSFGDIRVEFVQDDTGIGATISPGNETWFSLVSSSYNDTPTLMLYITEGGAMELITEYLLFGVAVETAKEVDGTIMFAVFEEEEIIVNVSSTFEDGEPNTFIYKGVDERYDVVTSPEYEAPLSEQDETLPLITDFQNALDYVVERLP